MNQEKVDESAWVKSESSGGASATIVKNLEEIKQYLHTAFDKLDRNGNGFIETEELNAALLDESIPMKEKSFITFLVMNQSDLCEFHEEDGNPNPTGISREDLEHYFQIAIKKFSP